jgi:hypothetical protein
MSNLPRADASCENVGPLPTAAKPCWLVMVTLAVLSASRAVFAPALLVMVTTVVVGVTNVVHFASPLGMSIDAITHFWPSELRKVLDADVIDRIEVFDAWRNRMSIWLEALRVMVTPPVLPACANTVWETLSAPAAPRRRKITVRVAATAQSDATWPITP